MEQIFGYPLRGKKLQALKEFLSREGLDYDEGIRFTVLLTEGDAILATGSLDGSVCKCIAVSAAHQGENLTATVITALRQQAFSQGIRHLFLYTKPKNRLLFEQLSFYPVAETEDTLLMENQRDGIAQFVRSLGRPDKSGVVGAVVANCNPFTLGHQYLLEQAASACDLVHLFILSEEKSLFPAADRLALARAGTAHLPNVLVHETGNYLISSATFPTYFIRDKERIPAIRCRLDLEIFSRWFAPALGITRRFVGSEPFSAVTDAYNREMLAFLPPRGIEVTVLARKELGGEAISASRVRALLEQGALAETRALVPETTFAYLQTHFPALPR